MPEHCQKPTPKFSGWNWGAFLLTWIWGVGNRVWIALIALIPVVHLVMAVILAIKGDEWAWRKNRCFSPAEFKKIQKNWAIWGAITIPVYILLIIAAIYFAVNQMNQNDDMRLRDTQKIVKARETISAVNRYKLDHEMQCPVSLDELYDSYAKQDLIDFSSANFTYTSNGKQCRLSVELEDEENPELKNDADPQNGRKFDVEAEDISNLQIYRE